ARRVDMGDREGRGSTSTGIDRLPLVLAQSTVDRRLSGPGGRSGSGFVLLLGLGHRRQLERRIERIDEDTGRGVYHLNVPAAFYLRPEHRGGADADSEQATRGAGRQSAVLLLGASRRQMAGLPDDLRRALLDGGRHADHAPAGFPAHFVHGTRWGVPPG